MTEDYFFNFIVWAFITFLIGFVVGHAHSMREEKKRRVNETRVKEFICYGKNGNGGLHTLIRLTPDEMRNLAVCHAQKSYKLVAKNFDIEVTFE